MNTVRYIKSFSKGQITIPKVIRDELGVENDFWLKIYTEEDKIIAEPVERQKSKADYRKKLLSIKGTWINPREIERNRQEIEKRLKKYDL